MTLKEFLAIEASYSGNIGMMEMFKFYQVATPEQKGRMKDLLMHGKHSEAWDLLKKVTGVELQDV